MAFDRDGEWHDPDPEDPGTGDGELPPLYPGDMGDSAPYPPEPGPDHPWDPTPAPPEPEAPKTPEAPKPPTPPLPPIPPPPQPPDPYHPSGGGGGSSVASNPGPNADLTRLINQLLGNSQKTMAWAEEDRLKSREFGEKVRANIMEELAKAKEPVDPNDPIIAAQAQVADFANQRTLQQLREAGAARGAATGGPTSGAADAAVQSGVENVGIANAQNRSRLLASEVDKRRASAQHLIDTQAGVLSGDEAVAAQRDLGNLGATVTSLRNRADEMSVNRDIDLRQMLGLGSLANQRYGLETGNRQFYDQLGYTSSHDAALLDYLYAQLAGG